VLRHLEQQISLLADLDPIATGAICSIIVEEQQHRDQSARHIRVDNFWTKIVEPVVSASTETVIWLGMRM
jgi:ubiquinone biosynthesis monooxygenase Coq7